MKIISKLLSLFAVIVLQLSCTRIGRESLSGHFSGLDGANDGSHSLTAALSMTGDGTLTGVWRSDGHIKEGHLTGTRGLFSNDLSLKVLVGDCRGEFKGEFTYERTALKGVLKDNAQCPERMFTFEVKKTEI